MESQEPTEVAQSQAETLVTSRNHLDQPLSRIWKTVLRVEEVNPADNFFALGGDSMAMMQIMIQVREQLGVELDHRVLYESPSLSDFCEIVAHAKSAARSTAG